MTAMFYISAAIAILSTFMVITRMNAVHALINLVVSLLAVAVLFYVLGSPFAAALEVIIYAGAIMVLLIFVIMMLHLGNESIEQEKQWFSLSMWKVPGLLSLVLFVELLYMIMTTDTASFEAVVVDARQVGLALYGPYVIAVELAAILLLVGIVGAYYLGKEKTRVLHRFLKKEQND